MAFNLSEITFLHAHRDEIDQVDLPLTKTSMLNDLAELKERFGDNSRAVAELIQARRSGKFLPGWLADSESAQQATAPAIARVRAAKLAAAGVDIVHDVTCSVGTEGAALSDANLAYLGTDIDRSRLAMARLNLPNAWFACADALTPVSTRGVVIADPARRAGGRRISRPEDLKPPLADLINAYPGRELAIKCAPGLDYTQWRGGVSIVSYNGGVKEACLYTPGLLTRREAVIIRGAAHGEHVDIITSEMPDEVPAGAARPGEIDKFIIDPDGAIVRAGLVRHYAVREGLHQLDERIAYLTGPRIPKGASGFEFIEQVPVKKLKSALHTLGAGSLEILVRGVNVDPDDLRKRLKLKGDTPYAVILTRIGRGATALICRAREWNYYGNDELGV